MDTQSRGHSGDQHLVAELMKELAQLPPVDVSQIRVIPVSVTGYSHDGQPPYSAFDIAVRVDNADSSRILWTGSFMRTTASLMHSHNQLKSLGEVLTELWRSPEVQIRARRVMASLKETTGHKASTTGTLLPDTEAMLGKPWIPPAS